MGTPIDPPLRPWPLFVLALAAGLLAASPPRAATRPVPHPPPPLASAATVAPFTVAVLGDAFGEALAEGLHLDLDGDGGFAIAEATHAPHGLASAPPFDWPGAVGALLAARRVDGAVVMLGADDVAPIRDGATTAEPSSPAWRTLYGDRVAAVAEAFRARGVPLIWVGLPIVEDAGRAAIYAAINEIVRDRSVGAGAAYVDSWDAFADEGGRYAATGPDRDGHPARLRTADGRDFTRAGALKLASFVDGALRRERAGTMASRAATTDVVLPSEPEVDNDIGAQIRRELGLPPLTEAPAPKAGPPGTAIVVTAPPLSPDGHLASVLPAPAPLPGMGGASLAERALVEGRPLAPRPGRIDDFSWPRR